MRSRPLLAFSAGIASLAALIGVFAATGSLGAAATPVLQAAVLQAMRHNPGALPARDVLGMATREGAKTLGLDDQIGSIEVGKRADVIVVDRDRPHLAPCPDPYSTLVYAVRGSDVRSTIVDGEVLVDDFAPVRVDRAQLAAAASRLKELHG